MRGAVRIRVLCLFATACLSHGCGGGGAQAVVSSPFDPEDAAYFDDGADFVADPTLLEGRWREEWADEFIGRIDKADVIALVRIVTVRTSVDLNHRTSYHLVPESKQALWQELPDAVELVVREGAPGYASVDHALERLQRGEYVLFIKWYTNDVGQIAAHWHLSPGTSPVIARTLYLVEHRRMPEDQRHRVIVVTHENG